MNKLLTELRLHNTFRVAGVYAVVGWILARKRFPATMETCWEK